MNTPSINQQLWAQKRVNKIRGFYTHLMATFIVLPFIIFVNLYTIPEVQWFWHAIAAWVVGLLIHLGVFVIDSKVKLNEDWTSKRVNEILEESDREDDFVNEKFYLEAKKKMNEIKGFYIHVFVTVASIPIIVYVNLTFVPEFHFFWLAVGGIAISIFLHWLGVFGFEFLGLGKKWEERKIKELLKNRRDGL